MTARLLCRLWLRIAVFTIAAVLFHHFYPFTTLYLGFTKTNVMIPNQAHFVYILSDPNADFAFQFRHYLSIVSIIYHCQQDTVYLHTNAYNKSINRARENKSGRWDHYIFSLPQLVINYVEPPSIAGNGQEIKLMEHKSDFVRVQVLNNFGGIYVDFDVYALKNPIDLLRSGYSAVAGREPFEEINSGIFMSVQNGKWISQWKTQMHRVFDGRWATHTDALITIVGDTLAACNPKELLILERVAFCPSSWFEKDVTELFQTHKDGYRSLSSTEMTDQEQNPPWAMDWKSTYFLHAFQIERLNNITPQYVLDNNSNFGRALYPVTKYMLDVGLISVDDMNS